MIEDGQQKHALGQSHMRFANHNVRLDKFNIQSFFEVLGRKIQQFFVVFKKSSLLFSVELFKQSKDMENINHFIF